MEIPFFKKMANSSARKSKSKGFRIIEYLVTKSNTVYLLDIYSKADQSDIEDTRVIDHLKRNETQFE